MNIDKNKMLRPGEGEKRYPCYSCAGTGVIKPVGEPPRPCSECKGTGDGEIKVNKSTYSTK